MYGANFTQRGKARTELYIDLGEHSKNKYVFDKLFDMKDEIEGALGNQVSWERLDNKRASRLALYIDGSIDESDAELEKVRNWHIEQLLKFKAALGKKIGRLSKDAVNL